MTKVVSVLVHRRLVYLAQTLDALYQCDGIDEYEVLLHAHTPVDRDTLNLVRSFDAIRGTRSHFYATPLTDAEMEDRQDRVAAGTFGALDIAFRTAPFVIHLEDDVLLAPDALRWFEWAGLWCDSAHRFTASVYSECADGEIGEHPTFLATAWATWDDRWQEMRDRWHERRAGQPWDDAMQAIRGERVVVHPHGRSLAQHIGHEGGAPTTARTETALWVAA